MTISHNQYVDAVEQDRDYAVRQREIWAKKLEQAKIEHEKWNNQVNHLFHLYGRISISGQSAFNEDKK